MGEYYEIDSLLDDNMNDNMNDSDDYYYDDDGYDTDKISSSEAYFNQYFESDNDDIQWVYKRNDFTQQYDDYTPCKKVRYRPALRRLRWKKCRTGDGPNRFYSTRQINIALSEIGGKNAYNAIGRSPKCVEPPNEIYSPWEQSNVISNQPLPLPLHKWDKIITQRKQKKMKIKAIKSVGVRKFLANSNKSKYPVHFSSFKDFSQHFYKTYQKSLVNCLNDSFYRSVEGFRLTPLPSQITNKFLSVMSTTKKYPSLSFHGTPLKNMQSICDLGLIEAGRSGVEMTNGNRYGSGIYSSRQAWYALNHSRNVSSVFVCAVLELDSKTITRHTFQKSITKPTQILIPTPKPNRTIIVTKDSSLIVPLFLMDYEETEMPDRSYASSGRRFYRLLSKKKRSKC